MTRMVAGQIDDECTERENRREHHDPAEHVGAIELSGGGGEAEISRAQAVTADVERIARPNPGRIVNPERYHDHERLQEIHHGGGAEARVKPETQTAPDRVVGVE